MAAAIYGGFGTISGFSELGGLFGGGTALTTAGATFEEALLGGVTSSVVGSVEAFLGVKYMASGGSGNGSATEDAPRQPGGDESPQQQQEQGNGNYRNTHQSGQTYSGKGGTDRMNTSANRIANANNDPVVNQAHTPAADETQSLIQEQNDIDAAGGPGGNTYNKINSPGKKLRDGK